MCTSIRLTVHKEFLINLRYSADIGHVSNMVISTRFSLTLKALEVCKHIVLKCFTISLCFSRKGALNPVFFLCISKSSFALLLACQSVHPSRMPFLPFFLPKKLFSGENEREALSLVHRRQ